MSAPRRRRRSPAPDQRVESLQRLFEELGCRGYEARVLLALVRLGSATASELAGLADVARTSVYPVLEALAAKGLAEPLPGRRGVWAPAGREEVLDRLYAARAAELENLKTRAGEAREVLAQLAPPGPPASLPFVHVLRDVTETVQTWERLLSTTSSELMMFSRPPYAWAAGDVNTTVLDTAARGVRMRVVYECSLVDDPANLAYRQEVEIYLDAGVEARMVDELPMKLEVFDRQVVLVSMADPVVPEAGYPTTLLLEHPGYAAFQADAFEQRWAAARPYPRLRLSASGADSELVSAAMDAATR